MYDLTNRSHSLNIISNKSHSKYLHKVNQFSKLNILVLKNSLMHQRFFSMAILEDNRYLNWKYNHKLDTQWKLYKLHWNSRKSTVISDSFNWKSEENNSKGRPNTDSPELEFKVLGVLLNILFDEQHLHLQLLIVFGNWSIVHVWDHIHMLLAVCTIYLIYVC